MNIAVCVNSLSAGGAESFATALALEYKKRGHEVVFIVLRIIDNKGYSLAKELESNNIELINLEYSSKLKLMLFPLKLARIFKRRNIQVVHSHLEQMDMLVALSSYIFTKPKLIRTLHSMNAFPGFNKNIHKFLFKKFDKSIGCGTLMKKNYTIPSFREFIYPIDNGIKYIELLDKEILKIRNAVREELSIAPNTFIFLQIGRMTPVLGALCKGHDFTINAVHSMKRDDFKVVFIGDNSAKNNPELYNQEYITDERLLFRGITDNPIKYILASDAILAPSRVEGLPISTLEGAFYSKPVICSTIDVFNIFFNNSTLRMDIDNPEELAEKMCTMMDEYPNLQKMALLNANLYRESFSIEKTCEEYLSVIDHL